eukprot:SAG11_NODE_3823_length_2206_cov_5.701946_2_plen_165_part_00
MGLMGALIASTFVCLMTRCSGGTAPTSLPVRTIFPSEDPEICITIISYEVRRPIHSLHLAEITAQRCVERWMHDNAISSPFPYTLSRTVRLSACCILCMQTERASLELLQSVYSSLVEYLETQAGSNGALLRYELLWLDNGSSDAARRAFMGAHTTMVHAGNEN